VNNAIQVGSISLPIHHFLVMADPIFGHFLAVIAIHDGIDA